MKLFIIMTLMGFIAVLPLKAQTILEKKSGISGGASELNPVMQKKLNEVNKELVELRGELTRIYQEVAENYKTGKTSDSYIPLVEKAKEVRKKMHALNTEWLEVARRNGEGEKYGLWQQPETTLEQLIIDYGSEDYVYLMSPEVASIKISVNSNLPIPRATWNEMLELILSHNGVGIHQLNPYLRELYMTAGNNSVRHLVADAEDLDLFPPQERVAFLLTPDSSDVKRIVLFLSRFIDKSTTVMEPLGRNILLISSASELKELLKLYSFVAADRMSNEYKMIPLHKVRAEEMAKILMAVFDQMGESGPPPLSDKGRGPKRRNEVMPSPNSFNTEANSFRVVVLEGLSQAILVLGTYEEIAKAEKLIQDIEGQIGGPREKVIHWYTAKHSNAEELAAVLSQIYDAMFNKMMLETGKKDKTEVDVNVTTSQNTPPFTNLYADTFYQEGDVLVDTKPISYGNRGNAPVGQIQISSNFIVDPKTGSIIMVVEQDLLNPMKEVIVKLDIPKKMVQIEVLLVEKAIHDTKEMGLNLLRIGGSATNTRLTSIQFNDASNPLTGSNNGQLGILDFTISRMKHEFWPAFDAAYRFLLMRDDVQINANPSVMTLNQTTATFRLLEEVSISTGVFTVPTQGENSLKDSFTRAQYGINLEITPTIHMGSASGRDGLNFISLKTVVGFDTFRATSDSRPPITRRQIINEVLIPDGDTVILGGLRNRTSQDTMEQVPFLGELPGLGKLFSIKTSVDTSTEMFIFITPRIIADPCEDLERVKMEQMQRRPGDIPDFMWSLHVSRELERERLLAGSMELLFGRPEDGFFETESPCRSRRCYGEWDGR